MSSAAEKTPADLQRLRALKRLLARAQDRRQVLSDEELHELPRLYRHACSLVARFEAAGTHPRLVADARVLVGRAHEVLLHEGGTRRRSLLASAYALFIREAPRAIRREWRLCLVSLGIMYGLAIAAWIGVSRDLDLAYSLLQPAMLENQIEQLRETAQGEPFRGNFTFGLGESPTTAGMIILNNIGVGILFFASALVPPVYLWLLGSNALMLGTYTAVAGHWNQAGSISSILWCHGMLEIQAFVLAGTAGLVLVRAWVRPGAWTRGHALVRESRQALRILAPIFPLLFVSGLIEAFVSPHAPLAVRLSVAIATGFLLLAWILLGGRTSRTGNATRTRRASPLIPG